MAPHISRTAQTGPEKRNNHRRRKDFYFIFYVWGVYCQTREKYLLQERVGIGMNPYKVFLALVRPWTLGTKLFPTPEPRLHPNTRHLSLFSIRTILKVAERRELLSGPPRFVSSPWALNQAGRNERPGPLFSGTARTCALAQWQKAAKEVFATTSDAVPHSSRRINKVKSFHREYCRHITQLDGDQSVFHNYLIILSWENIRARLNVWID